MHLTPLSEVSRVGKSVDSEERKTGCISDLETLFFSLFFFFFFLSFFFSLHIRFQATFRLRFGSPLTPSLPSLYNFRAEKCSHHATNSIFSNPLTNLISILCSLMKILSRANARRKRKRLKHFKFGTILGDFQMTSWQ